MRITREWLDANAPCADGGSWGAFEVGPAGLDLSECWPKFNRADWLLWLLWKTNTAKLADLREFVHDYLKARLTKTPAVLASEVFDDANAAGLLGRLTLSRELMAWGYVRKSYELAGLHDGEKILHALQAAVVQFSISYLDGKPREYSDGFNGAHDVFCRMLKARFGVSREVNAQ